MSDLLLKIGSGGATVYLTVGGYAGVCPGRVLLLLEHHRHLQVVGAQHAPGRFVAMGLEWLRHRRVVQAHGVLGRSRSSLPPEPAVRRAGRRGWQWALLALSCDVLNRVARPLVEVAMQPQEPGRLREPCAPQLRFGDGERPHLLALRRLQVVSRHQAHRCRLLVLPPAITWRPPMCRFSCRWRRRLAPHPGQQGQVVAHHRADRRQGRGDIWDILVHLLLHRTVEGSTLMMQLLIGLGLEVDSATLHVTQGGRASRLSMCGSMVADDCRGTRRTCCLRGIVLRSPC